VQDRGKREDNPFSTGGVRLGIVSMIEILSKQYKKRSSRASEFVENHPTISTHIESGVLIELVILI